MFIISDVFPKAVVQPTEFEVSIDGAAAVPSVPTKDATGQEFFHFDVSGLPNGTHTIVVKSRNENGDSVASSPFVFVNGVPGAPQNLRFSNV